MKQLTELKKLPFEEYPAASETQGFGRNIGKTFRTLDTVALINDRAHRVTLKIGRHQTPVAIAEATLAAAEKQLETLREQSNVRDMCTYAAKLSKKNDQVDQLADALRKAKQTNAPAKADKLKVTDHGITSEQRQQDLAAKGAENLDRPSAAFVKSFCDEGKVEINEVQWELIANYLEGVTEQTPFFFMGGISWQEAMIAAGAVVEHDGKRSADGAAFRASYQAFLNGKQSH